jgi:hypothetical protein
MPTTRKPANKAKSSTSTRVKAEPGTVQRRKDTANLEARVTELEKLIDLLSLRVAVAESTAQTGLYRIAQLQPQPDREILGI